MNDHPKWFAPKRYGYGAGLPISWEGWALTILFVALLIGVAIALRNRPGLMIVVTAPLILAFMIACAPTTRGGWRWRWGDKD